MRIRLSEKDAAALGCPEIVEFDESRVGAREAVAMQRQTGYTLDRLGWALEGRAARGPDGMPLYERDERGEDKEDEQGRRIPLREIDVEALVVAVWLAVRRSGCDIAYADFDFDLVGMSVVDDDEGKG